MRFFLSIATFVSLVLMALSFTACSDNASTAGIEIGNPNIADKDTVAQDTSVKPPVDVPPEVALPLTAGFSVDYSDVEPTSVLKKSALKKSSVKNETVILDSFALVLSEVRTFASYYTYMRNYDPLKGRCVWPDVCESADTLQTPFVVSFADGAFVDDAFSKIDLLDGGFLKEIAVSFKPYAADNIYGRILIDGKYVPFVYSLSNFRSLQLRYHYSQIEIDSVNKVANLSVVFRAKLFAGDVDFSNASIFEDGVIYIDEKNNEDLWNELNGRFVSSFQPLRYETTDASGVDSMAYIADIWKGLAAGVNENTILNGDFDSPFTTDWILVEQYGGKADTTLVKETNDEYIMEVDVVEGGDSSFSVQLLQENVALIAGVKYVCVFTIWSDVADSITARIGSYATYETIGFSKHVPVGKSGKSIQIEFTPEVTDPFARFELNLGKSRRKFWIKEVQVIRLTE